jgi:NAD-dependent deacetylase
MSRSIVILTGAGISAESGIQTFRGVDGLWEGHRIEDVATPEGFARDPVLVQRFYNERRQGLLAGVEPNRGHLALARLEKAFNGEVVLVTQNIDNLHERGGSEQVLHMHGELLKARCLDCEETQEILIDLDHKSRCSCCHSKGRLRPDIVWFGEMPFFMPEIEKALQSAGFVEMARSAGAKTIEVNLAETAGSSSFARTVRGKAGECLPDLVDELLA